MRPLFLAAALSLAAAPAFAADPVEGEWMASGGIAKVHIGPCAGQAARLCGQIVWLKEPKDETGQLKHDARNPDPKLRDRPIIGLPFLRDFKQAGPGKWNGGKIYDPDSGKTYDSKMQINANGTLKLDGCVLVICQAQTWTRPG